MKLTFLGTGTSFGVPQLGCDCDVCRSSDVRDRRTRVGALVETDGGANILIDTPPELRLQLLGARVTHVDAVLFTHEHADHTHGIDDLRAMSARQKTHLPMYGSAETLTALREKFRYIFDDRMKPLPGTTKPEGTAVVVLPWVPFRVADVDVTPIPVPHGAITVYGYRLGALGYVTDAKSVPDDAVAALAGVDVLVLNTLFRRPHPSHLSLEESLVVAARIAARVTYLTHLTHDNFHGALERELSARGTPGRVIPAHDGLVVKVQG